jgi:hypothetical protein
VFNPHWNGIFVIGVACDIRLEVLPIRAQRLVHIRVIPYLTRNAQNGGLNCVDKVVGCGGAGSDTDGLDAVEPLRLEVARPLDMVDARTEFRTSLNQLTGIVAISSADHDDDVGLDSEVLGCPLTLLGGLAHRIDKTNFRIRETATNQLSEVPDTGNGLCGLRGDAKTGPWHKLLDIGFRLDNIEGRKVLSESTDFNMVVLADDDRVKTICDKAGNSAMREGDERTSTFEDLKSPRARAGDSGIRSAVCRDHSGVGLDLIEIGLELDSAMTEIREDRFVVDEFAEDGQRLAESSGLGERDRVADAETHTEMFCFDDFHMLQPWKITLYYKVKA